MEQEHEVLDWGNEEEEHHQEPLRTPSFVEDADDAVSLGDEEDDNTFYSHQVQENGSSSLPSTVKVAESDPDSLESGHFQDLDIDESSHSHHVFPQEEPQTSSTTQADGPAQNNSSKRAQNLLLPRLTHALPPKPVAASLPYLPPSHPSIVEATAMSARTREYKRSSGSADKPPSQHKDQLPPNWEIRYPRSGARTAYYYNTVTHQSTWQHPGLPTSNRTKSTGSSSKPPLTDIYVPQPLTYEDRHYRPGELPDFRRDDRASDEPELRRPTTPPTRSPRSHERLRSPSRSPPAPREIPAENQEKNRSRRSNHDADLKGDSSHQSRDHSLHVSETSAPRHTASKSQNESSGHSNRETYNQQVVPAGLSPPVNEDRLSLSKSNSVRGHNRERLEREPLHDTIEGRQGPNHSLSLSSSRPRSPSAPYDREWIPARREQRETEPAQNPSVKPETTSRSATAPRRERPSRFDQPSTAPQTPPAVVSAIIAEQTAPQPVYIPADLQASDGLSPPDSDSTRPPEQSPIAGSRLLHAGDNRSPLTDNAPNRQVLPLDVERSLPVSDQSGAPSRRKRAPLPPQAASFREETSKRRDHDPPRSGAIRPGAIPFPTLSQEYHSDAHSTGTSSRGTPQSVPHSRIEPHVEHRRRVSFNDGQYESNNARRGNDNERSAKGYPQTRAHPSIDAPMDIDVVRMPSSSSKVPPDLPERAQDDDSPHRPTKAISSRSSGAGATPSAEASISYPPGDSRREGLRDDILEQQLPPGRLDHPPRNERAFHERPDRHGPRRESGGRSNEHRAASSGSVPKLTGPNSVPIGTRRQTGFSNDLNPPVPEYAPVPKFSVELPPRPPSIAPGKELYNRVSEGRLIKSNVDPQPSYNARTSVDNFAADQHGYAEPGQLRQNISPSYKRNQQSEPIDAVPREGRLDNQPRERSRLGQPAREDRVPPPYDNEPQSRTRSSSSERLSTRNRPPAQWPPPETRIQAQLPPPEFLPGKSMPPRISEEDRFYRPGRQDNYRERTEDYMPSPVDGLASRSRRPSIHSASLDGPYGGRITEHLPLPSSPDHGGPSDRNHYPPSRQQRPPERARPAEIFTPNAATASSERRTRRSDAPQSLLASGVPDSPDHRAVRRLSVMDRYEPDYGDGYPGVSSRRRPRPAKEDNQRIESNHRGEVPYVPGPHHDHEFNRPSGRPLLDRLSLDTVHPPMNEVRDRATIPEKRDRNAVDHDYPMDIPYEEAVMGSEAGEPVAKKARRRGHKPRRGRRGNGAS